MILSYPLYAPLHFPTAFSSPQLDTPDRAGKLTYCLQKELGKCNKEHETRSLEFKECFIRHFFQCPYKLQSLLEGTDIKFYFRVKKLHEFVLSKIGRVKHR
jgi:hypothetical protein